MPPESLPFDRKDFLKDRKPSSLDPAGIAPPRWREPPTTPSQHNNHVSSSSCRWGGGGGLSDFRRPFSGHHGKRVGAGCQITTVESGNKENNGNATSQKDPKGNSHPHYDIVNSSDQHPKNNGGGASTTNSQRLEKDNSLGSSLDWKPVKWIRSGSLSSRGSGFSHQSSCKIIGMDPLDTKSDGQQCNSTSGDVGLCVTPRTPDDVSSRKKPRLGWGEGLAKYEKKKVDPDDILDKDDGLLTSPSNVSDKSPSVNGYPECASPTTPYSFACSSSPGVEDKQSMKTATVDNDTCNPCAASCHVSENVMENLELNLSSSLDELLQIDDSGSPVSGFVKSTAMDKLQVLKAGITRTLEITETEIDSLECEMKSLLSDIEGSCSFPDASSSFPTECNNKSCEETSGPLPVEKTDSSPEDVTGVEGSDDKSPDTTSECSEDLGSNDVLGYASSCGDGSEVSTGCDSTDSDVGDVHYVREDKLYDQILTTNKAIANRASDELSRMLLPNTLLCTSISKATNDSLIKERFYTRKRFLKLKERVVTSKFRALQHSWKEDLHLLSSRRFGAKSQKKFESSSHHQKQCSPFHSRFPSPGGSMSTETLDYVKKLLSDSRVKVCRNTLKMPCLVLDRRERMMTRFISDNGLVENPIEVEKERSVLNAWTKEEEEIFLKNYSLFGKDFKKISASLKRRTIADCVEFYYKNHKSDRFQNAKKKSVFAKEGKSCSTSNTYLVTSGKRLNLEAGATSLEMLGAASVMVANVDSQLKCRPNHHDQKLASERSNDFSMLCNEQETAAADVLAGICGSLSSEAFGSCITQTSVDHGDHVMKSSCSHLRPEDVDEETCSDDSCGEEDMDLVLWTDQEKLRFIKAVRSYGKDFMMISRSMRTKSTDQCRVFYSKARKCLGLDAIDGGGSSDHEDACMVDNGSDISHDNKTDEIVLENKAQVDMAGEMCSNHPYSDSSCASESKQEGIKESELELPIEDLNTKLNVSENGVLTSNLFPQDPDMKTVSSRDNDVSSRLSFRKSCDKIYQTSSSSTDAYHLHLPEHSETLSRHPVDNGLTYNTQNNFNLLMDPCLPTDSVLSDVSVSQQPRKSGGDVKLFGQILSKSPQESVSVGGNSVNLKFDDNYSNNLPLRSYGFWDGNRIQTGLPSIPDSARLLAKYPDCFSKTSTFFEFDQNQNQQLHSGFPTRKPSSNNGGASYGTHELFAVDKLLLPESTMNVVGGVSDPVAAIRMHYANTQHYKNGNGR
ncbi:hypothetical protein L2E82_32388 [Cichorium intybus]|uniref:Uncharacterized protein n=1 Tax=Cichorium intybus TaxID=13427 RepID=A0ACB9BH33_CICIN|nr:hypothetical protein L2E82_32388 [Cichorium intybus]